MVRNQTNKVAVRTQKAVADAFLALIRERAYEGISVTDICKRADIVRKTFYNNFKSKDDVVHHLIDGIFCEMESRVDFRHTSVREILLFAFRFVLDNREALLL
ncbi:MAG: TetR family transcriptional regulator, partial [Clostridiales bacterium]|nr:TetR family transcriptional regulator [Clostridiales bacterium]